MNTILLIETATPVCSVALCVGDNVLLEMHCDEANAHSARMPKLIDGLMAQTSVPFSQLDAVCVSRGPGSYTGLRIGVSSAKGFCYALGKPLLSVPTLQSMAMLYYLQHPDYDGIVVPMIDARRMECYTAVYQCQQGRAEELRQVEAQVIEPDIFNDYASRQITLIGDGAPKTQPVFAACGNIFVDASFSISAAGMAPIAIDKLQHGDFEDVAYFEPFYLKDFVAKKSVVRGLR